MTFPGEGRAGGGHPTAARAPLGPSPVFALAAVGGGVVEGALFGIVYALAVFLPAQLFDPSTEGGTGSPGLTVTTTVIGFGIGAFIGGLMGFAATPGLVVAWALGLRRAWAVSLGSAGVALALVASFFVLPPDAPSSVLATIALAHAIVGLALVDGVGRHYRRERNS